MRTHLGWRAWSVVLVLAAGAPLAPVSQLVAPRHGLTSLGFFFLLSVAVAAALAGAAVPAIRAGRWRAVVALAVGIGTLSAVHFLVLFGFVGGSSTARWAAAGATLAGAATAIVARHAATAAERASGPSAGLTTR